MLRVLCADWPEQHPRIQPRRIRRRDRHLKLTLEDLRRHGEIFRNATGAEIFGREELRQTLARPRSETLAMFSSPGVCGEFVHERPEMTAVSDRYLKRLIHRREAGATPVPAHILLARLGGRREGMHGHC